jgi:UDP-GlcNAc3NAcA epimerase
MKMVTIIGARPQFIKAAMVSRAVVESNARGVASIREVIVNTGQHYDFNMSRVFFDELGIPEPDHHLGVGSASHGQMTAQIISKTEDVLLSEMPDWVLVYGDTNSTLAGAIAACKLNMPIAHVEAGLRSFNKCMPEEVNRILTDHVSRLLFAPTHTAILNLNREGIAEGVIQSGDVMLDAFLHYKEIATQHCFMQDKLGLTPKHYYLATVHRQENTDDNNRLSNILLALEEIGSPEMPVVLPLHPRTGKILKEINAQTGPGIKIIEPVGYLEMIQLENNAAIILTDSGGVQKEAYFSGTPCITLRDETEWVETVEVGVNIIAGARKDDILSAFQQAGKVDFQSKTGLYGNGHAAEVIVEMLLQ